MDREYKGFRLVRLVIICILLNFGGKILAEFLNLPLWLDTIGTVMAAYCLGPICGAMIGACTNIMYASFDPLCLIYSITGVITGFLVGLLSKKSMLKNAFLASSLAMILAVTGALTSVGLNLIIFDGMTGNMWGDATINLMLELGIPRIISCFMGEFCVDLLDRLVSVLLIFEVFKMRSKLHVNKGIIAGVIACVLGALISLTGPVVNTQAAINYSNYYDTYIKKIFNKENGIPGSEVNAIEQTRDGLLWVGTYGGLYQYDGNKFTFFSQFDSVHNVNCLYSDEEGRLLVGTNDSGLSLCANGEIVNVIDKTGGLPSDSIRSITQSSDGIYYVGTSEELCSFVLSDGIQINDVYSELEYVYRLEALSNGYVAGITTDGKFAIINAEGIYKQMGDDKSEEYYTAVYFNDGLLYLANGNSQVIVYKFENGEMEQTRLIECKPLKRINDIRLGEQGNILVCADNGIGCISEDNSFGLVNTNGFDYSVDNILVDYQGNYWFSSSRLGLLEFSKSIAEEVYTKAGFESTVVNSVIKWNGRYFFGTDIGLFITDERLEKQVQIAIAAELKNVRIRNLMIDSNNHLWISASGVGLFEYEISGKIKKYDTTNGLKSNKTRLAVELGDQTIAVSTDSGISFIKDGVVVGSLDSMDGLSTRALCLLEHKGVLYAGTDGSGISLIKNGKVIKNITKENGLSSDVILRIVPSKVEDGLYVIASNAINFIDKEGNISQFKNFPYYDNFDIVTTEGEKLWITSSAGVFIVKEKDLFENGELEYELLDSKKGLQSGLIANSYNYLDKSGRLFLCCNSGVLAIDIDSYDMQRVSYRISLQNVVIDGVLTPVDKEDINYIGRNAVRVEFKPLVINYSTSDPLISVYLEGFDEEPRVMYQHELESLTYTNLHSGEYTFRLAILDGSVENILEEISYTFIKEKDLQDNWWFILYLLVLGGIVIAYFVWLIVGSQISKTVALQKKELENLKLKQEADAALAAGEAKNKFLALMSHDIRTPINAIIGMNEMILRESNEKQIYEYATDIQGAGNNLLSLVNTILDFSKIEEGKMEIIPVRYETRKLFNNIINGISTRAKNKGLEVRVNVEQDIPSVLFGDDIRLSQVISNLMTNAVKYTNSGYISLTVKEKNRENDKIVLYVEVADSGIGIKKEDLGKLFEDFTRLEEKRNRNIEGTGLGMSIVSSLLKMMNSKIEVESTYGVGSRFFFEVEQQVLESEPVGDILKTDIQLDKRQDTHVKAPKASILVVDDNKLNIKVICNLLKVNEIVPDTAMDGYTALAYMRNKHYDIVFLDHMMPDMDGIETFKHIKEEKLNMYTRVIVLTANAISGAREEYISEGFDDYLTKPIDVFSLEQQLRNYLPDEVIFEGGEAHEDYELIENSEVTGKKEAETGAVNVVAQQKANEDVTASDTVDSEETSESIAEAENPERDRLQSICPEIEYEVGMRYCMGSLEFYQEVLKEYLDGNKSEALEGYFAQKDLANYRVLIHAVKSNSLSIGAVEISERAKALEMAAKEQDVKLIENDHPGFMADYKKLLSNINEYFS